MALIAKNTQDSFEPIPDGIYQAVCIGLIDIGTQYNQKFDKKAHQIILTWEIPELTFSKDGKDLPRQISKKYSLTLGEKSNLRKDLRSWRGRDFTEEELAGFNMENILGKNCMLQILSEKKGEKTYSNINSVLPLYKGMEIKVASSLISYTIGEGDIPEAVPGWIKEMIMASEEMTPGTDIPNDPPLEDDVPF